jgi:hypothetical protein
MPPHKPYLSVVVTSRNDNHGGDLLRRMQTFLDTLGELAKDYRVSLELIVVEWNPPADRPPLADVLHWPENNDYCQCRVIVVPPEAHQRYEIGDRLPMMQMIAKNVGIRRATGEFVVATNIDILFSAELFHWLSERPLRAGRHYRLDRFDVAAEVMDITDTRERLKQCPEHLLRVCTAYSSVDRDFWTRYQAWRSRPLVDRLCQGSLTERFWFWRATINGQFPNLVNGSYLTRLLERECEAWHSSSQRDGWQKFANFLIVLTGRLLSFAGRNGKRIQRSIERTCDLFVQVFVLSLGDLWRQPQFALTKFIERLQVLTRVRKRLHTNACGDFTLMSRDDWFRLGGYAEFPIFSWHLDTLLLFAARQAGIEQEFLPSVVYHIEHLGGWTPQGEEQLFGRLDHRGIPYLTNIDVENYCHAWRLLSDPPQLNGQSWGLADEALPERLIGDPVTAKWRYDSASPLRPAQNLPAAEPIKIADAA